MARSKGRTGRPWRRLVEWVKTHMPHVCAICGQPINMALRFPHPMSFSVHHLVSLKAGGAPRSRHNVAPAHLGCNSRLGAGHAEPVRSRRW